MTAAALPPTAGVVFEPVDPVCLAPAEPGGGFFYMPPDAPDAACDWWADALRTLATSRVFQAERAARGLFPLVVIGPDFDRYVRAQVAAFHALAREFELIGGSCTALVRFSGPNGSERLWPHPDRRRAVPAQDKSV